MFVASFDQELEIRIHTKKWRNNFPLKIHIQQFIIWYFIILISCQKNKTKEFMVTKKKWARLDNCFFVKKYCVQKECVNCQHWKHVRRCSCAKFCLNQKQRQQVWTKNKNTKTEGVRICDWLMKWSHMTSCIMCSDAFAIKQKIVK